MSFIVFIEDNLFLFGCENIGENLERFEKQGKIYFKNSVAFLKEFSILYLQLRDSPTIIKLDYNLKTRKLFRFYLSPLRNKRNKFRT